MNLRDVLARPKTVQAFQIGVLEKGNTKFCQKMEQYNCKNNFTHVISLGASRSRKRKPGRDKVGGLERENTELCQEMEQYDCRNNFTRVIPLESSRSHKRKPGEDEVLMDNKLGHHIAYTNGLALHVAVIERNVGKVKELLECGADIHVTDPCHLTPLHRAVVLGNTDIVKELLKYGSNVDVTNECGFTPMHDAILAENLEMVKELLKYGAHVHTLCNNRSTPMKLAVRQRSAKMVEELLKYGSNTNEDLQNCLEIFYTLSLDMRYAELFIKYILIQTCDDDLSMLLNSRQYMRSFGYRYALITFFKQCIYEILQMKSINVNVRVTLYEFVMLKNSNIVLSPSNESTRKITDRQMLIANYPVYSNLILAKVDRGILLNKLNNLFPYTYTCGSSKKLARVMLDYECTLSLVQYLCDDDLEAFVQAYFN